MLEKTDPNDVWPSEITEAARILSQREAYVESTYKTVKGDLDHPDLIRAFTERNQAYGRLLRLCEARPAQSPKKYVGSNSR